MYFRMECEAKFPNTQMFAYNRRKLKIVDKYLRLIK